MLIVQNMKPKGQFFKQVNVHLIKIPSCFAYIFPNIPQLALYAGNISMFCDFCYKIRFFKKKVHLKEILLLKHSLGYNVYSLFLTPISVSLLCFSCRSRDMFALSGKQPSFSISIICLYSTYYTFSRK